MKVPFGSIPIQQVKDLFYPNKDTKGKSPEKILAVGRPGIGKTVLTEKIMRDWAGSRVDECYYEKIAFYFKFRWSNENEQNAITLKTFLRNGTGLSDEKFDKIYEYITAQPEKAILVFDGLDEFNGNSDCLNHSQPPNDPNICMSWTALFIKLISRRFLPKATIVVTSRPTAHEFYSRFSFDRSVEIIGFTEDKIEEFVQKLCDNNGKSSLKPKIWKKIKSTSDILNVCYIPVNCWIVSTILFECLKDPESDFASLPTTLTEIYQEAITHLDKHHFRKFDAKANKKLQKLAFEGIEQVRLVFPNESFDEQMKKSGLLNKLYNPLSQGQQQFCFIHLTIQEFLAAKHVTETLTPQEIHEFVTSHVTSGKWHLVLQFIAGLLGKKITKFFETIYTDCVLAFGECLIVENGILHLPNDISLCVIKCLREVDDESLIEKCTEATAMNVVCLTYVVHRLLPLREFTAVAFVCKYMKNLISLDIQFADNYSGHTVDVLKLLEQRCMKKLCIMAGRFIGICINVKPLFSALLKSSCTVKHEHSKITELDFRHLHISDWTGPHTSSFFKNENAHYLEKLVLQACVIDADKTSVVLAVVEVLEHCPNLTYLALSENRLSYENVKVLCGQKLFNLTQLYLEESSLKDECIPPICEFLTDERCNLTHFSLEDNKDLSDECLRMLSNRVLVKEHCKLENLNVSQCSITHGGAQELCKALLQNEHCKLIELNLGYNRLTDQCMPDLCKALQNEHCKLIELILAGNQLTDQCIPKLCKALQNEHCKLIALNLAFNKLTDYCIPELCKALQNEHCKLIELNLGHNRLTDKCIPDLCKALKSESKLTVLSLADNKGITNEGLRMLCELLLTNEHCNLEKLNLWGCSLSNDCIPHLRKAVENEHFSLKELKLKSYVFSEEKLHQLGTDKIKFRFEQSYNLVYH